MPHRSPCHAIAVLLFQKGRSPRKLLPHSIDDTSLPTQSVGLPHFEFSVAILRFTVAAYLHLNTALRESCQCRNAP
jgi:hypothetical protein